MECPMTYQQWTETLGQYRWRTSAGTPRTYTPLVNDYPALFDYVTTAADNYFSMYEINDVDYFTNAFINQVPTAWLHFKTQVELMTGTLTGSNIDPNVFEAGFTRTTASNRDVNTEQSVNSNSQGKTSYTDGERSDSTTQITHENSDTKNRNILYNQGVQGTSPQNGNIGELGIEYASSLQDAITTDNKNQNITNENTKGQQININTTDATNTAESTGKNTDVFSETVHETRINYYDNLAFLRDRYDRLPKIKTFTDFFLPFFYSFESTKLPY